MSSTTFDVLSAQLGRQSSRLPVARRTLLLLANAERLLGVYELFERRRPGALPVRFEHVLTELWTAAREEREPRIHDDTWTILIPGETWVVDGFHDAVAQYVGGLAYGTMTGLANGVIRGSPEDGAFEVARVLLSEMRLGCLEPGSDAIGTAFDSQLHLEPLAVETLAFNRRVLDSLKRRTMSVNELHRMATGARLDPALCEPALTEGLRSDGALI